MTILKFALKRSLRNPTAIIVSFILPIGLMLPAGLWEPEARGYYFITMVILFGSFPLTGGMLKDRREQTIVRIMSTPTTTFKYLSQNLIACIIPMLLQVIIISLMGYILHDWSLELTIFLGVIYGIFATTSIAFSFAWNCLFKSKEVSFTVLSMILTLWLFAGIMFPLEMLPEILRTIFMIFPTYWVASGIGELVAYGATVQFGLTILVLTFYVVIFILYGSKRGTY